MKFHSKGKKESQGWGGVGWGETQKQKKKIFNPHDKQQNLPFQI